MRFTLLSICTLALQLTACGGGGSSVPATPHEFIIAGSQSILGSVPHPQEVFTVSMEADIYPKEAPELAEKIDGAIGEGDRKSVV